LYDQRGLYIEVAPSGGKWWRLKYRLGDKEKRISLGTYPLVGLKEARDRAFEARKLVEQGIDPSQRKKSLAGQGAATFGAVMREWWEKFQQPSGGKTPGELWRRAERDILPFLGDMPIEKITPADVLGVLRRVEARGTLETAHKVKNHISQTMRYAVACGLAPFDPARDLSHAMPPRRKKHMAAIIDPREAGALMRAINDYPRGMVRCALKLAALTFVRPGELRTAEWSEVFMEDLEWRIPAAKMKMGRPHIVPLSSQSIRVLTELRLITGHVRWLFPSTRGADRPMSDMTVNAALRALGYARDKMTGHGFRAMASSLLAEQGWGIDAIERQLAHVERNQVRAAYHRSDHLEERRRMMQAWADYLDTLAAVP
jgi:integrase